MTLWDVLAFPWRWWRDRLEMARMQREARAKSRKRQQLDLRTRAMLRGLERQRNTPPPRERPPRS